MNNSGSQIQASAHFSIENDGSFSVGGMTGIKSISSPLVGNAIDVVFSEGVNGNNNTVIVNGDEDHPTSYRFADPDFTTLRITWAGGPTFPRHIDVLVLYRSGVEVVTGQIVSLLLRAIRQSQKVSDHGAR